MTSSSAKMIDLTSDSDDELECTGSLACPVPKQRSSNWKSLRSLQAEDSKQRQQDPADDNSAREVSKDTSTLVCSGSKLILTDSLTELTWNGFAGPRKKTPSNFRTPSPFTQVPVDCNRSTETRGVYLEKHDKKRMREGSISMYTKKNRYSSPDLIACGTNWLDTENVDEGFQYDVYRASPSPSPRGREATADEIDHSVIILDDDDQLDELIETSSTNWNRVSKKKGPPSLNPDYLLVDLDDEEDELFEEIEMLAPRESPPPGRSGTIIKPRNPPIVYPWVFEEFTLTEAGKFEVGDVVELKSSGFLRISIIMKNLETDNIRLRGSLLERTRVLNGLLPKKLNELYFNVEIEQDDPRPSMVQSMEEVDLCQVLAIRNTRMTNQVFPSCSFRETGGYHDEVVAELSAPCAVRWRYSCKYLTARDRWHNRWNERSIDHLKQEDLSQDDRLSLIVSDAKVRSRYRGITVPGGAYPGSEMPDGIKPAVKTKVQSDSNNPAVVIIDEEPEWEHLRRSVSVIQLSEKRENVHSSNKGSDDVLYPLRQRDVSLSRVAIDLSDSRVASPPTEGFISAPTAQYSESAARKLSVRSPGQKYTYGDCFCGAGGATRGAVMAGLKPIWGFDSNKHACASWRLNFPDAILYEEWADQLIQRGMRSSCLKCDILHLSPPCQYFSPAHTIEGKDDEMNMASLFACGMLLDVAKPRIATLEQTFGIALLPRFQAYFNALIQMFTDRGFSIRWKICPLQNWGLPQRRQRLIIIASCPGEVLPEFPPFTHADPSKGSSVLPTWVSVNSVIRSIPRGAPNHDIELVLAKTPLNCRPWSGDSIAPRCITTHGGHNYHPSGKRGFTNREYACLQGFPMNHRFGQVNVKKQIGNAVPPCIAKVLFSWIKKSLEKADGIQPEDEKSEILQSGNFQTEAIVLD